MFTAPAPIKNYLCKQYGLHKNPVFSAKADKHIERLTNEFRLQKFFVGNTMYTCIKSRYSNQLATTSRKIVCKK